jgi:hypothetical protein
MLAFTRYSPAMTARLRLVPLVRWYRCWRQRPHVHVPLYGCLVSNGREQR